MYRKGRLWGFNIPLNLQFVFQLCMHKKYCPSCAPVFMKFKNFVQENVKMCTLFSHFASVYWLYPWTQFGDFCSPDALAPPILDNSWSTSCETPPLWSPGYAYGATSQFLFPHGFSLWLPRHWGNVRSPYVGYCSSCYSQKNVMNFSSKWHQCHKNCCLNKPYFMLKMYQIHNSVHTFHISLAITQREREIMP